MKILVFEFITGGGFSQQALPRSLTGEALLMLNALLAELNRFSNIQLTVVLDWRIEPSELEKNTRVITISKDQCLYKSLPELIAEVDYVWPIAPEFEGILQRISKLVEKQCKQLLNSSSEAVALCSDKLLTSQLLQQQAIAAVKTTSLALFSKQLTGQRVIKPKDGAGCLNSYLVSNANELSLVIKQIDCLTDYIIQPYVEGDLLSLSCLFKNGKAWLLCCNRQVVSIENNQFQLDSCTANITIEQPDVYPALIDSIANAIPGLFGYVGIDIIVPESGQPLVLEINPRLTTSYVGINSAIGFNVAKAVVEMVEVNPVVQKKTNQQVLVPIS